MSTTHKRFWILKGREAVKKFIRRCVVFLKGGRQDVQSSTIEHLGERPLGKNGKNREAVPEERHLTSVPSYNELSTILTEIESIINA